MQISVLGWELTDSRSFRSRFDGYNLQIEKRFLCSRWFDWFRKFSLASCCWEFEESCFSPLVCCRFYEKFAIDFVKCMRRGEDWEEISRSAEKFGFWSGWIGGWGIWAFDNLGFLGFPLIDPSIGFGLLGRASALFLWIVWLLGQLKVKNIPSVAFKAFWVSNPYFGGQGELPFRFD